MTTTREYADVWVCTDCYFAHHYGASEHDGKWYANESDSPCESGEPLRLLDNYETSDNTCSNHSVEDLYDEDGDRTGETSACEDCGQTDYETGIEDFSWRRCDGCGSTLGGSRYRLAIWTTNTEPLKG
jgi:ribosomal protein L37AE/L43A